MSNIKSPLIWLSGPEWGQGQSFLPSLWTRTESGYTVRPCQVDLLWKARRPPPLRSHNPWLFLEQRCFRMLLPRGCLPINWKLKPFRYKTICAQFDVYFEGKFPATQNKDSTPIITAGAPFLSQFQKVGSKSLERSWRAFPEVRNSWAANQKRQLLAAENSLPGPQDQVTECGFPWHSQKQVAPKLWKSTFPYSTADQLFSTDMGISSTQEWGVRCLQDKPGKLQKVEEWPMEGGPEDTVGCRLNDMIALTITNSCFLRYFLPVTDYSYN